MSRTLALVATITALPQHQAQVEAHLRTLVAASREETACIQYDLHQQQDAPAVFVMIEQWRDAAALEEHKQTAHYQHFSTSCSELLQGVEIKLLTQIA
ncbi:putative quinol monooxygenase [Pseudomonas segetis]|uniref:Quinol monooxygenase YgiN n=1 Tax=Pseudomonas segetis TaxID=298908 RepID=A0A239H0I8_9PSED|nr:putative quinol monooxygenase [Pseudomonas segetis]SNS73794.1 Quinol monooxygenase YgiN [Pseudomonas segetis]